MRFLYTCNVMLAVGTYFNLLALVVMLPFQVYLLPHNIGPVWPYVFAVLLALFEYALWPLEIASFWFNTEEQMSALLHNNTIYARWSGLSVIWGWVTLVILMLSSALPIAQPGLNSRMIHVGLRAATLGQFFLCNLFFWLYLNRVVKSAGFKQHVDMIERGQRLRLRDGKTTLILIDSI
jgi:hypothetical protein